MQFVHTWERVMEQKEPGGWLTYYIDRNTVTKADGTTIEACFVIKRHDTERGTTYDVMWPYKEGTTAKGFTTLDYEAAHAVIAAYLEGMQH